jgi:hypothetical protein
MGLSMALWLKDHHQWFKGLSMAAMLSHGGSDGKVHNHVYCYSADENVLSAS